MYRTTYFPEHRQLDQMDCKTTFYSSEKQSNSLKNKTAVSVIIFFLIILPGFTQEPVTQLSYDKLQKFEEDALSKKNLERLRRLSQVHAEKAKAEKNPIEVAKAFYYRLFTEELELGLLYADSIVFLTENSNHPNYPALGYLLKGNFLYQAGRSPEALENYLKAYSSSTEKENVEHQRLSSLAIAAIRSVNGQHSAASKIYSENLQILKQQKDYTITHYEDYLTLLYNLSLTHIRLSQLDSAKYFNDQGIKTTTILKDKVNLQDFILVDAQLNYYNKNFKRTKDTIEKYLNLQVGTNRAIKLYYLGKSEQKLGAQSRAIKYFLEIDSIVNSTGDPFNEIKDVYQQLILQSSIDKNSRGQIYYIERLIYYDSILSSEQQEVTDQAIVAYDIPFLKHQKQKAENKLRVKSATVNGIGALAFLATCSGLFFYHRNRKMKYKLKLLIQDNNKKEITSKGEAEHTISVPDEIRTDILNKLLEFEEEGIYLRKEIDMSILAQEFGTNTSYLSTVVNHYKKMTFPNYLKDLKITAAISRLKVEPELLKYNYQGLAEIFGFKTADSFSKAFYQKTGVYPSKFLNELKSNKGEVNL